MLDAGYFYTTFKHSQLVMDLVRLSKHKKIEDRRQATLKAMEEIKNFKPEVILLYTEKETTELMLQQVLLFTHLFL